MDHAVIAAQHNEPVPFLQLQGAAQRHARSPRGHAPQGRFPRGLARRDYVSERAIR
jgi:hypothetical protein